MNKMRLFVFLLLALLLTGCTVFGISGLIGSGRTVTQSYDFSDFTGVDISNAFQVEIVMADGYSVEVTVDDNVVDHLQVEQEGHLVRIGLDNTVQVARGTLRAEISMPSLTRLDVSGASRVGISGFKSVEDVDVTVSGASIVQGDLEAGALTADASGASTLTLQGNAATLNATASGASTVDLSDFPVTDAEVNASGASGITVDVSGTLRAEASGASTVRYAGSPAVARSEATGASTIAPQ